MNTYKINAGFSPQHTVEAASYGIQDGYFHFSDTDKARVFSIAAARVVTVELIKD